MAVKRKFHTARQSGLATISILTLMAIASAILTVMWRHQAQMSHQNTAIQIASARERDRQVVWQRLREGLMQRPRPSVLATPFTAPTGRIADWWQTGVSPDDHEAAVISQGQRLTGWPTSLPANHPIRQALFWREVFTTADGITTWRVTIRFAGGATTPTRWQQAWWRAPKSPSEGTP